MTSPATHLPAGYSLRVMEERDHPSIAAICKAVYPNEPPYSHAELVAHHRVFPEGQFVVQHDESQRAVGGHFTLIVRMKSFFLDDSWETVTAGDTFADHDPAHGETLYGADLIVDPNHQHHGIGRALTLAARELAVARRLWRMVGGSRMPGYGKYVNALPPDTYIARVKEGTLVDPVLTAHLHDGWDVLAPIRGYLPFDVESAGWSAVIDWINQNCPPPAGEEVDRLPRHRPL
ncbi:MAG: GNAT family N-acetyltransferase [Phycisphaerae bacterium]|nr:GNAT family N-acetyltransferase [Phycisphaerae bacterium]